MFEICVKSIAFQYVDEEHFIKESKTFSLPTDIYRHIIAEICEDPMNIEDHLINTELNYTLNFPPHSGNNGNWCKCGDGNWCKQGKKLKEDKTLKLILHSLCNSSTWYNHYLHVYWDYNKTILTFEEEYGDKYEN